jgi:hypothetical protein
MNDNSSGVPDAGTSEEPALTQRNTATVQGVEDLSADAAATGGSASTSTSTSSSGSGSGGAAPTYGPAGNTTDAEEEGADGAGI